MAEPMPPQGAPQGPPPGGQQGNMPQPQDIWEMARQFLHDPKQLLMFGQAMTSLLKVGGALQPPPDPAQMIGQPGPMEQLAVLDLERRKKEWAQTQAAVQRAGMPIPQQQLPQ